MGIPFGASINLNNFQIQNFVAHATGSPPVSPLSGMLWFNTTANTLNVFNSGAWQGLGLPSGTSGQTLRHNGTAWVANSALFNDGTNIGIGTVLPLARLDVNGTGRFNELWINNPAQTARYIIAPSAITANRVISLPLSIQDDTFVLQNHSQILTNKTIDLANNTVIGLPQTNPTVNRLPKLISANNYGDSTISEVNGNVIMVKDAHLAGAQDAHLELQAPMGTATGEISLRFHQASRWWSQIRARSDGFRFTQGSNDALVPINASTVNATTVNATNGVFSGLIRADNYQTRNYNYRYGSMIINTNNYLFTITTVGNGDSDYARVKYYDGGLGLYREIQIVIRNNSDVNQVFVYPLNSSGGGISNVQIRYMNRVNDNKITDFYITAITTMFFNQMVEVFGERIRRDLTNAENSSLISVGLDNNIHTSVIGNVGIRTPNPLFPLDVGGAARVNELRINNPLQSFQYIITPSAISANRTINLPLITADDTFMLLNAVQNVVGQKNFSNGALRVNNPANTFNYRFVGGAIIADRQITLPLLTENDTFVFANTPQTLTGKTINISNNNIIGVIRGSGAANRIPKFIANDTVGLSDIYEIGGLTGFGVPSPQQKIHVEGNIRISGVGRGIIFSDGTTLTSALSNVGITGIFQMPAFVQGTFYMNNLHNNILGLTSFPIIANTVYLMPFVVAGNRNLSIDQIGINVEVAATAGTFSAVIGIYNDGGIGVPNQLVNQVTVTGLNSTGSKVSAITQTFEAGILYFLAIHSGCNCTIRALTANSQLSMGLSGSNDTIALNRIDRVLTWGTALPIAWNFNAAERNTNSALQVIFRAAPTTAPATPTGLSVTQNTGFDVSATWNTVPLATTYVLEHRINGGAITQVETSANSWWNNPPYVAGQLVEVRVAARNNIGISAFTAWATVTIVGAPDVPTGLAVIETGGGLIQATWNASLHATSYVVESNSTTFGTRYTEVSTTSWGGDGVYNIGDNVTVRVAARNNRGDSAFSTPVGVIITGESQAPV